MPHALPRPAATFAALLVPCALPAPAVAASIAPLKPCYVSVAEGRTEPVALAGSGFGANAGVEVRLDGTPVATVTSTADGHVYARINLPHQARGQRVFKIALVQHGDPARRARARSRVSALAVALRPRAAQPRSTVTWVGRGFTSPAPIHVHYSKDGEFRRTIRLVNPRGPCGAFRIRRSQFPFDPSIGRWVLQVDQQRAFAPVPDTPFVQLPVTVRAVARR